jgi:outer membrane protein TolC
MVVDNWPEPAAPPDRELRSGRCWKRTARAAIAVAVLPIVLAFGCTTTPRNPIALDSSHGPSVAIVPSQISRPATANPTSGPMIRLAAYAPGTEPPAPPPNPLPSLPSHETAEILPVDLPTALRLTNANNPTIALARERVEEAYAAQRQADVAWLPNLQAGPQYERHDGRDQSTNGPIVEVSKQSLFINGGATLDWNSSDILFGPLVAERLVEAQSAAAQATSSDVQLSAAQAYFDLQRIQGELTINSDTFARAKEMLENSTAADKAGLTKTAGDINRARAEYDIRLAEEIQLQGNLGVASARLAHILLLRPTVMLKPADMKIVPITLVPENSGPDELMATALSNRPEIQAGRAASAAAMVRLRQAKVGPFLPHFDISYFGGTFGGGTNSQMSDFGARSDGEVDIYWQLHNLGAGDVAQARAREVQLSETNFQLEEVRAQIGEDVMAAYRQVEAYHRSLDSAEQAVRQAMETWRRIREASFGMAGQQHLYDPLQPLIAERDLNQARVGYLNAVIGYNKAQFQLYWALGQPPLQAPTGDRPQSTMLPVIPEAGAEEVPPPATIPPAQ